MMMKNEINSRLSALLARLCAVLLSMLGFGCSSDEPCMYGTPVRTYEIKGKVTDPAGRPVDAADIRVLRPDMMSGVHRYVQTVTGKDGGYSVVWADAPEREFKVVCVPVGSTLEPDSVIVEMTVAGDGQPESGNASEATATVDFRLGYSTDPR